MGSALSGDRTPRPNRRPLVSTATRADVFRMWDLGLLTPHNPKTGPFPLDWQPVSLGGFRPWFLCPQCGKRCRYLYVLNKVWGCRRCSGLGYLSERLSGGDRMEYFNRVQKPLFYKRMGAVPQVSPKGHPVIPPCPDGMDPIVYNDLVCDFLEQYLKALEWLEKKAYSMMKAAIAVISG